MEIRTLDEVRAGRVRVTVDVELSGARYTDEDVARLQASEAELVAAPLRRRIGELEAGLTEIDKEADRLRGVVIEYDLDRHTERERADKAQARVRELEQSLAARDRLLEAANRRLSAARDLLTADAVAQARGMDCSRLGATMADAIGNALRVLDQA